MIELKAIKVKNDWIDGNIYPEVYDKDEVDTYIATLQGANDEKTERIVELQKQVDKLDGVKKSAEQILQNLLYCGLIKDWYFNGKFNAFLKADDPHLQIAELKKKLEDVNELIKTARTAYAESVDAGMENRRLKRALWLARAERAASWQIHFSLCHNHSIEREFSINGASMPCEGMVVMRTARDWAMIWKKVESKCRAKSKEYL